MENSPGAEGREGCLTVAVRLPVRVVVVVLVLPVRVVWDLLVSGVEALWRGVVVPVGRVLVVVPFGWLYGLVLTPLGHAISWVYRVVLTPMGRGVGWLLWAVFVWPWVTLWRYVAAPVLRYGLVVPAVWLYRHLLAPLAVLLLVVPAVWLHRTVLAPLGRAALVVLREIGAALGHAWRIGGFVSRAVGRGLKWLAWNLAGRPLRWAYATLLAPVGHWVRDAVLRPAARVAREALATARETVRSAGRDAWRALVGGPPRERGEHRARTLGSTTTASGAVPAPEISLRKTEG
ncbi:hypothetical protein ACFYZ9_20985 [Streptomyces sp. NPDC001691]|uniref:hypothetical protein n=1 Tax=Streptomyces sp. NPDC001691 TaxID=3364600 RepID=UPI003678622C